MAIQNSNEITLFSSESTEKYIKDIFAVLALPRNADYRFRYEKKYVENKVCTLFDNPTNCIGTKALIAFRSKSVEEESKRFIVPIRWVEITKVEYRSDFYTVMFKVLGYPTFTQAFSQKCYEFCNINTIAKSILDSKTNNFAVISNVLSEMVNGYQNDVNTDNDSWLKIVKVLTCIKHYEDYHFLKCSPFFYADDKNNPIRNNSTILEEGECAYLKIEYYQEKYDAADSSIDVIFDKNIISQSLGLRTKMDARYDSIKLGFQPKKTMNETLSEIIICTSESGKLPIELSLPITIVKRKPLLLLKSLIMGAGALLVALPALLPDTVDVKWKIIIAIGGACVMGVNHFINSNGK